MFQLRYIFLVTFLLTLCKSVLSEFNLTIVHINDFHSRWFEFNDYEKTCTDEESADGNCYGGFPRILTAIRELRKTEPNLLVLSTGEFFYGNSFSHLHGYRIAKQLLPQLGINAMSLSNHDFDVGLRDLSAFLYKMAFPVLCSNMVAKNTSFLYSRVNASAVLDVNGTKIGVIGYTHPLALEKSIRAASVSFIDELPAVKSEASDLVSQGINKIIALGHSGYHTDFQIAKGVKDVDIVIGGNSNIVIEKPINESDYKIAGNIYENYPRIHHHMEKPLVEREKKSLILHIPQHGKYLGVVRVTFDDEGNIVHESGEPMLLDKSIPQDEASLLYLKKAEQFLDRIRDESFRYPVTTDEFLAITKQDLDGNARNCRTKECTLGNFVTDAMLHAYDSNTEKYGKVDAVVINSGIILHSIEAGSVKLKDLFHALICGDQMIRTSMSGSDLKEMMEKSVLHYDPTGVSSSGAFLQISGLKVEYDLSSPKGNRVKTLFIRDRLTKEMQPVEDHKTYLISMPSFIQMGQDGYPVYKPAEDIPDAVSGNQDMTLILGYLIDHPVIKPKLDSRITFYDKNNETHLNKTTEGSIPSTTKKSVSLITNTSTNDSGKNEQVLSAIKTESPLLKPQSQSASISLNKTNSIDETSKPTFSTQNAPGALPNKHESVLTSDIAKDIEATSKMPSSKSLSTNDSEKKEQELRISDVGLPNEHKSELSDHPDLQFTRVAFQKVSTDAKDVKTMPEVPNSLPSKENGNKKTIEDVAEPVHNAAADSFYGDFEDILVSAVIAETIKQAKRLTEATMDILGERLKMHLLKQTKLETEHIPYDKLLKMVGMDEKILHASSTNENSDAPTNSNYDQLKKNFQSSSKIDKHDEKHDLKGNSDKHPIKEEKASNPVTDFSDKEAEAFKDLMVTTVVDSILTKVKKSVNASSTKNSEDNGDKTMAANQSKEDLHDEVQAVTEMAERIITEANLKMREIQNSNPSHVEKLNKSKIKTSTENPSISNMKQTETSNVENLKKPFKSDKNILGNM